MVTMHGLIAPNGGMICSPTATPWEGPGECNKHRYRIGPRCRGSKS